MSEEVLPREGSIVYNIKYGDKESKQKTLRKWKLINKYLVVPLARLRLLPIFGLRNTFVVISVVGRKSGKRRRAGIQLRIVNDRFYVFLARGMNTQWYKNHLENPEETKIYYGFRKRPADFRQLDGEEKLEVMSTYVQEHPRWAKLGIGWKESDSLSDGLLEDYINTIEILEIQFRDTQ